MVDRLRLRRLRGAATLLAQRLHLSVWFPHLPLAVLMIIGGASLLEVYFGGQWEGYIAQLLKQQQSLSPVLLPPLLIGGGLLVMAVGILFRSRLAWVVTLLLVTVASISVSIEPNGHGLITYFIFLLVVLFLFWRHFDRSSVAASTLFALTSVIMLVGYSTFGAYYLGAQFGPPIKDLVTALYWSMVTMSTVGYGDISPKTSDAMLFTVSVIILGVAVFATALTAVIGPLVSQSFARIVSQRGSKMKRENHFVVIGNTPLAANTARSLASRGQAVTRLFSAAPNAKEPEEFDQVVGDPSSAEALKEAGADKAAAVLAMLADDSENAFVVLAVRELAAKVETIVAVNDSSHLQRIKLVQPDILIAPQVLGGELAAMLLSGEKVTPDFVMERVFERLAPKV